MNKEPFGNKCKYGQYENKHIAQKHDFSELNVIPEM
jgi:hypothetical protein